MIFALPKQFECRMASMYAFSLYRPPKSRPPVHFALVVATQAREIKSLT